MECRVGLDDFCGQVLGLDARPDPRRRRRAGECARQMTEWGLAGRDTAGCLIARDLPGLRRVAQAGLDAYGRERP